MATDITKKNKFWQTAIQLAKDYDDKIHHKETGSSNNEPADSGNNSRTSESGATPQTQEDWEHYYSNWSD